MLSLVRKFRGIEVERFPRKTNRAAYPLRALLCARARVLFARLTGPALINISDAVHVGCDIAFDVGISMLRTHCRLLSNPSITLDFIPPFLPSATKDPRDTFTYANAF